MLALSYRFHGHNSLRPLYQKGRQVYSRNLKLLWRPTDDGSRRVAVVVSKKVHKSAVVRNRIRRRIYGIVEKFFTAEKVQCDLIFLVQNMSPATMPAAELHDEVMILLKKVSSSR